MEAMSGAEQAIARFQARQDAKAKQGAGGGLLGATGGGAMRMLAAGAGIFAGAKLSQEMMQVGQDSLEMARDLEVSQMQLKTLAGSAVQAKRMMQELRTLAPMTPYSVDDLSQTTRKFVSRYGADGSLAITKRLASVGATYGSDIGSLGKAYADVVGAGVFQRDEMNQFGEAGFPVDEFAKTAGIAMSEFREKMHDGLIPVSVMEDTFKRLTEAGGVAENALRDFGETARGRANREKAEHEAWMAEKAKALEGMGATLEALGRFKDKVLITSQYGYASLFSGIGDSVSAGKFGFEDVRNAVLARANPDDPRYSDQAYMKQIAEERAERQRVIKAKADAEQKAIDDVKAAKLAAIQRVEDLERKGAEKAEAAWMEREAARGERIRNDAADNGLGITALDKYRELQANRLGDSIGAARYIQQMRDALPKFSLPNAALRGSSEESAVLSRAMESIMGSKNGMSVEDILKQTKEIEERQKEELEKIRQQLEKMLKPVQKAAF